MPFKIRAYACEDCGRWTVRKRKSVHPWICEQCGLERRWYAFAPWKRPKPYGDPGNRPPPKRRS